MIHTFVIAAFGESEFLEDCIKSLLKQTVTSEIKIATSTDNEHIRKLARKYDLAVYLNEDGGSIGKDWNYCLKIADTPLITIAHQDDIYEKNYTQSIIDLYKKDPCVAIYFTGYHEIRNGEVVIDNINLRIKRALLAPFAIHPSRGTQRLALALGCSICCPSVTYNMNVLDKFYFDTKLHSNLDWKAWAELYEEGYRFSYSPRALVLHRIHPNSETSSIIDQNERSKEDQEIFERFWSKPIAGLINKIYKLSEKKN